MATNLLQVGEYLNLEKSGVSSGDPVNIGFIKGVAVTDSDADDMISISLKGVYNLSVVANNGSEGAAVSIGDKVYLEGTTLNVDSSKLYFGIALEAITSGDTATIPVLIIQG